MFYEFRLGEKLPGLVEKMMKSYEREPKTRHLGERVLPDRREIVHIIRLLLELIYPGFYGRQDLNEHNLAYHVGELLPRVGVRLHRQIHCCLCYKEGTTRDQGGGLRERAAELTLAFLERIPEIRERLAEDVQAAYDGDPAALNTDEVILSYPGVLAITIYRLAHELHEMGIPLMPRMMTEYAHAATGVDIHPGAKIGRAFFIDHATGVVIGETAEIGNNVKLYQGVTLGALSFPKDERGRLIRGYKRHPTVRDRVTIYANATVLGGETELGEDSVVGASAFLTRSVPAGCTAGAEQPEVRIRNKAKPA